MASPDIRRYVDLTLLDKDPQDVFEAALLELKTNLPEWIPREGNIEVLLLEALAMEVAEAIFTINRLPSGIVEVLLQLFGILRDSGAPPKVNLRFTVVNGLGYSIPAGVQAALTIPGGVAPVVFTTDAELVIPPGNTSGVVSATGDRFTDEANNALPNTVLELLDSILYVDTVTLDSIITGGRSPETDDNYFSRAMNRFSRLQDTLVLPKHFVAYALEQPDFYRAYAIDNWNGSTGVPGDHPGHITVAVYGNGTPATSQQKSDLEAAMEQITMANLSVHVIDPTITQVDVTATVKAFPGYVAAEVKSAVEQALTDYLNPMQWGWGAVVRRNELIALISNVEGVDYVDTLSVPANDVTLSGYAPLADAGVLTITVV